MFQKEAESGPYGLTAQTGPGLSHPHFGLGRRVRAERCCVSGIRELGQVVHRAVPGYASWGYMWVDSG